MSLSSFDRWKAVRLALIFGLTVGLASWSIHSFIEALHVLVAAGASFVTYLVLKLRCSEKALLLDLQNRKCAEEALEKSRERLALAQRIARIGSYELDLQTGDSEWSDGIYELLGLQPGGVKPSPEAFFQFIHPDDVRRVEEGLEEDFRLCRPHHSEYRIVRADGTELWVQGTGEFIRGADGKVLRVVGTVHDITVRKKWELAVRESEERIRLLLDSTGEGIIGVDQIGNCTFANPASLRLLGFRDASDILGRNLHAKIHHSWRDGLPISQLQCKAYLAMLNRRPVHVDDEVFWRQDGTCFDVEYSVHPIWRGGEFVGSVFTFSDVTKRKHVELELKDASRLKDLFTDILRHDLMNPATAAKVSCELLARREGDPTKARLIANIHKSVMRLIELCDNATKYARVSSVEKIERIDCVWRDLAAIVTRTMHEFEHELTAHALSIEYVGAEKCMAQVSPLLDDVFSNLISNAVKYSPRGSAIKVEIHEDGDACTVCIRDQGEGISDEHKQRVFTRFERLEKGCVKGTGLGLAIAKQIVDLHRGKIWIEDNPCGGSAFFVRVPKVSTELAASCLSAIGSFAAGQS